MTDIIKYFLVRIKKYFFTFARADAMFIKTFVLVTFVPKELNGRRSDSPAVRLYLIHNIRMFVLVCPNLLRPSFRFSDNPKLFLNRPSHTHYITPPAVFGDIYRPRLSPMWVGRWICVPQSNAYRHFG